MSDKYIIRNCPNYDDYFNPNETCKKKYSQYCQDCTDCVLKQIVKKCKYWETYESCYDCAWGGTFGKEILDFALHYRQKRTNKILRIYKCPFCKGYHLTSKAKFEEV